MEEGSREFVKVKYTATTKEDAIQEVKRLVEQYQSLDGKRIKSYSEADTRRVFILPLFKALGWDVYSREEVTEEERASRGRVDYAFHIRGIPKFFLEAKPLRADLDNPDYAKQVINYAYHKGVTWAVLTDFEGLKVFNADWREANIAKSLFFELRWDEYLNRFDQLWLLSRQAFEQELLDKEALKWGKKIKKTLVGQQLLSDLVTWRGVLHKYLSAYNRDKATYQIDEAVQRILDRLIFIRTCEDRQIDPYVLRPLVREWRNGARKDLLRDLREIWNDFNDGYNSRLFLPHLADELDCEPTPFEEVIEGLYATKDGAIEYDFNAIDADVLGGIYEQYLQHLLKRAGEEVEVIPERGKRKARGIYYTPKFVVSYIVENTLGRALEGKSLNEARKIRILDPACGSGSFLVEALDYLERHWRRQGWVTEGGEQADFFDYLTQVQFLNENLYGVDLDAQAVEIAQLNLLLKSAHQRALLPDLKNNVREGNSLISGTEAELRRYFGGRWRKKKPFNWEQEFDRIMAEGGFDVVIGNPPYLNIKMMLDDEKNFYRARYFSASASFDIYILFVEKGLELLRQDGRLGFIIPNKFIQATYARQFRQLLSQKATLEQIVDFGDLQVFKDSTTYPCILIVRNSQPQARDVKYVQVKQLATNLEEALAPSYGQSEYSDDRIKVATISQESLRQGEWRLRPTIELHAIQKMKNCSVPLSSLVDKIFVGLQITPVGVFAVRIVSECEKDSTTGAELVEVTSQEFENKRVLLEKELLRPLIKSSEIGRYELSPSGIYVVFPYEIRSAGNRVKATLIDERTMRTRYPYTFEYLQANRSKLESRDKGRWKHSEEWYGYSRRQNLECHSQCKIVTPNISTGSHFAWENGYYYLDRGSFGILPTKAGTKYQYLLGILNSRLGEYYVKQTSPYVSGGYYSFTTSYLNPFPICHIDFDNPTEKRMNDELVALVDRMLDLNKRLAPIRNTPCNERDELLREIERTDHQIDNLVYDLYGLTEEEREIVETGDS